MAERGGKVSGATGGAPGTATSGVALDGVPAAGLGVPSGSGTVVASGVRLPSKLIAGERPIQSPSKAMLAMTLDIRIARPLGRPPAIADRPFPARSHLLGVFPQIS